MFAYLTFWNTACVYLRQILFAQRAVGVVVQAPLQTFEAEGVTAGSGHWLIKQSGEEKTKSTEILTNCTLADFITKLYSDI